jgi:3-oxoacyl-[acyl-carrier-protein] synthase-3
MEHPSVWSAARAAESWSMHMTSIKIRSLGAYLPPSIRRNDWWDPAIVDNWSSRKGGLLKGPPSDFNELPGVVMAKAALAELEDDPFKGAVERRILAKGETVGGMELAAARDAISRASIKLDEIDGVIVISQVPDYLLVPHSSLLHRGLGLRSDVLTFDTYMACNSFLQQLTLAQALIAAGRCRNILLVQSTAAAHVCRPDDPVSAWCGDAATAQLISAAAPGEGLLASATRTDGSFFEAVVGGVPGTPWFDANERLHAYNQEKAKAREMLLKVADMGAEVVRDALEQAQLTAGEVDFFASHQATVWFRRVTQELIGMTQARFCDTFKWTGNLSACNVPFELYTAQKEGTLGPGQIVAMYSGGSGVTYTGVVMRWSNG